jgi:short-subunit dehydrogenase
VHFGFLAKGIVTKSTGKKVIILGALSAVAEATARIYAREGAALMLVGRDADKLAAIAADLKLRGAARAETAQIDLAGGDPAMALGGLVDRLGGLDDVILAYGILGDQTQAEADQAHAATIIDTDFRSAALWCLAVASRLEQQKHGALVVIGSVAGDRGRASNYVYGAAKAGLGVLVQGLAHRLAPSGARAVLVKPGFIDTPMTASFKKGPLWAKPEAIARIVRAAADRGGPIVYAPFFWRYILLVIRAAPASVLHKTKL